MSTTLLFHRRLWRLALLVWAVLMVCLLAAFCLKKCHTPPVDSTTLPASALLRVDLPANADHTSRYDYKGFTSYFDARWHIPRCVVYELTADHMHGNVRRHGNFQQDPHAAGCPMPTDYTHSGWDRGHLAPAAHMKWDSLAMRQSALMTNICPQNHRLNERAWQRLEAKCGEWAERYGSVMVYAGPIPGQWADTIRPAGVLVPRAFFKVVLAHRATPLTAVTFIYKNEPCRSDLHEHATTVREVERLTGLDFFPAYPRSLQNTLETAEALDAWLH